MNGHGRLVVVHDRIARAEEHFKTVKTMVGTYFYSDAYTIGGEYTAHDRSFTVPYFSSEPDIRLTTVVGEAVHNLRSALDHVAWQLVRLNGGNPTKHTYFPILKASPRPDAQGQPQYPKVEGGVSATASAVIERAQPYVLMGGGFEDAHPLALLHDLSNIDKHRHIPIRGLGLTGFLINGDYPTTDFRWSAVVMRVDEDGAVFRLVPHDPNVEVEAQARIDIQFVEPAQPAPVIGTLREIIGFVKNLVAEFERVCFSE